MTIDVEVPSQCLYDLSHTAKMDIGGLMCDD